MITRVNVSHWLFVSAFAVLVIPLVLGAALNHRRAILKHQVAMGMNYCVRIFESGGVPPSDATRMADVMEAVDQTNRISDSDLAWTLNLLHRPCLDYGAVIRINNGQEIVRLILRTISEADLSSKQRGNVYPACLWLMHGKRSLDRADGMILAWKVDDARLLPMLRQAANHDTASIVKTQASWALGMWGQKLKPKLGGRAEQFTVKLNRALLGRPIDSDSVGNFTS
jgi:hypothetical protein